MKCKLLLRCNCNVFYIPFVSVEEIEQFIDPAFVEQLSLSTNAKADLILAGMCVAITYF
jgi:hypothetical protein